MGLDMLKNGKAPGDDEIVAECLKKGGQGLLNQLHKLMNTIWEQEEIPEAWRISIICPIHKKGDIMECENYRGISLLNTSYKLLSNILLTRINPYIKEIIGEYQAGYMLGKSTTDQIHIVKQVVEKSHEYNKDTYLLFVDFKAAYDSINRDKLWEVMESLGIPAKLTRLIKSCTYNSKSKISFGGELSVEFQVTTGLRQGDALSPALFNIALESVMRTVISQAKGIEIKDNRHLTAVAYADDIVLLAETVDDLKYTTDILLKEGKKIGLKINETKTKYMIVSRQNHRSDSLKVNEYTFERVGNFKYLGADINEDANSHEEVKRRLIAANRCYYGLLPLFKSKLLSRKSKVTLYKVLVRPIALYASSTWATTKSDEKKLEVFERKILRKIFGPNKNNEGEYEIRSNKNLEELYNEPNITGILKSARIGWAGHVWRSKGLIGQITAWKPNAKRPRGRPRQRWVDRIKEDLKMLGIRNAEETAQNREEWRQYVVAAMDLKGL
uniref:Retrovirus-related Pol polyprotein LINE-1 n=2 Tax=Schizaphis graminum TaxID=13262 RepID=A0A2S2N6G4_SCHGA